MMRNIMMKLNTVLFAFVLTLTSSAFASAHGYKIADLEIKHPHARATLPNARVSGGYMSIKNNGTTPDRLIGVRVDFAGKSEIHEMKMDGDVMKMRELEKGLLLPAGETVELKSGGYHVMFMMMKEALKEDEKRKAILVFEKAGELEVTFKVETLKTIKERNKKAHGDMKEMDHSKMNHDDMNHDKMDHDKMHK
ncbi:MAG: copper chaperone PCu(A)C [Nitratireductor sp.]